MSREYAGVANCYDLRKPLSNDFGNMGEGDFQRGDLRIRGLEAELRKHLAERQLYFRTSHHHQHHHDQRHQDPKDQGNVSAADGYGRFHMCSIS